MKTKKHSLLLFIQNNKIILFGCLVGLIAGFCYWEQIGCYWGVYPYSSAWWVNALSGAILGGLASCSIQNRF